MLVLSYLLKILITVPQTSDPGEIISHVLLIKVSAMVIYPTLGGYVNYCEGFLFFDFPWLNDNFGEVFSNLTDVSPPGFLMFYLNLNLGSTYFLALLIFTLLSLAIFAIRFYKHRKEETNQDFFT